MDPLSAASGAISDAQLAAVVSQFQRWRANRTKMERIPEALWQAAVALYPRYNVNKIARTLGLDFVDVRDRIRAKANGRRALGSRAKIDRLHFMELPGSLGGGGQSECSVKVRNGRRGTRITFRLKGSGVGQLLETLRGLWGAAQ